MTELQISVKLIFGLSIQSLVRSEHHLCSDQCAKPRCGESAVASVFYRLGVAVAVGGARGVWERRAAREDGSVLVFLLLIMLRVQLCAAGTAQEIRARPGQPCLLFTSRSAHLIVHINEVKTTETHQLRSVQTHPAPKDIAPLLYI